MKFIVISFSVPTAKAQSFDEMLAQLPQIFDESRMPASKIFQIFVKIGGRHVVLNGSGESAVLREVVHQCTQRVALKSASIQLISQNKAHVLRDDATFAEVKAPSLQPVYFGSCRS